MGERVGRGGGNSGGNKSFRFHTLTHTEALAAWSASLLAALRVLDGWRLTRMRCRASGSRVLGHTVMQHRKEGGYRA